MQFVNQSSIVIINHIVVINILTQTTLMSININKLNFRLIRVLQYLFIINLKFRHKKKHIISNVLFRLQRIENSKNDEKNFEKIRRVLRRFVTIIDR